MLRIICCLTTVVALTGCAGNVKRISCTENDWARIGYETAVAGKSVRTFDAYSDQCVESPGDSAKKTYVDGFMKGIIEYCTVENGYELGVENRSHAGACPVELRSEFEKGYRLGKLEYDEKMHRMKRMAEEAREGEHNIPDRPLPPKERQL